MIGFRLGLTTKLPKGVNYTDFGVWQRPYIEDIRAWRKLRNREFILRRDAWRDIMSDGEHYFLRGILRHVSPVGLGYIAHPAGPAKSWVKTQFWPRDYELYLRSVPSGFHLVSKRRYAQMVLSDKPMLWWENLYDACDAAHAGATDWWWPYLDDDRAGIVCADDTDAVLVAAVLAA